MSTTASHRPKRVLILGSGFGGLYTAMHLEKKLRRASNVEVTLVNRENFFLFTPMLHEVAAGDLDVTHIVNPVRKLLRRSHFFNGDVKAINLAARDAGALDRTSNPTFAEEGETLKP